MGQSVKTYIVAGGRDFNDKRLFADTLDRLLCSRDHEFGMPDHPLRIIHGGCKTGADHMANEWAIAHWCDFRVYKAAWEEHGKAAGPIRNQQMAQDGDELIAFWDGKSRGTKDMIKKATRAGLTVHVIRYKP